MPTDEEIVRLKSEVADLLDISDHLSRYEVSLPDVLKGRLEHLRGKLIAEGWLGISTQIRQWGRQRGTYNSGIGILNILLKTREPLQLSQLAEKLDLGLPATFAAVEWWLYDYRMLHDKVLPFECEWTRRQIASYRHNPKYSFCRQNNPDLEWPSSRRIGVCLGWNLWIGGEFPRVLLGLLPRVAVSFLPVWPAYDEDLKETEVLIVAYDRYISEPRPNDRDFKKLWFDRAEKPPGISLDFLRRWVYGGGTLVGLHDGGFDCAAQLLGIDAPYLLLKNDRKVVVRDVQGRSHDMGLGRNNYISVLSGPLGACDPWCFLEEQTDDLERVKGSGPLVVGFSAVHGSGRVIAYTFLAGPPSKEGELGQTDAAFYFSSEALRRALV